VVQFIGACTRKPNLCIVFEYMSGGSVYDWIRREGPLKLSQVGWHVSWEQQQQQRWLVVQPCVLGSGSRQHAA
jgi:hypothetical protein